jgi:chromosome segregation ATPase
LKIDNAQPELRRFESSLQECDRTLSYYSELIDQDRQQLERMKADNDSGLEVDENEYERVLRRHNNNVQLHNSELGTCRQMSANYKQLLNETNANIDLYNRMIR